MPALAAMAAIQGGMAIAGAIKQSSAAKKAAQIQQQAADRVAPIQRGVYQQQMAGMEPYAAVGRQNINSLMRLTNPGVGYSPQQQLADAQARYSARPPWSMTPGEGAPQGQLGTLANQLVQLRAPNGSVRAVPASQVDSFMQRGAVRV